MSAHGNRAQWLGAGLLLGQILSFVVCTALLLGYATGLVHFPGFTLATPVLLFLACSLGSLQTNLQGASAGLLRMGSLSRWLTISGVLQLLLIFPFTGSLPALGLGLLAATIGIGVLAIFALPHPKPAFSRRRLPHWLRLWLPFLSIGIVPGIASPLAQIALRQLAIGHDPAHAALWQAAQRLSDSAFPLWSAAVAAWMLPRLSQPGGGPGIFHSIRISLAGSLPLCLGLGLFAPLVLQLAYGHGFEEASSILRLQCGVEMVRAFSLPFSLVLIAHKRAWTYASFEIIGPVMQVSLAAIFLPRIGILAIPLASLCENVVYGLGTWWVCKADLRP
jgi:O-antigen/teichoic acid export membrane protein